MLKANIGKVFQPPNKLEKVEQTRVTRVCTTKCTEGAEAAIKILTFGNMNAFNNIDELLKMMGRERVLLKEMFQRRREGSLRYDVARELVECRQERLQFLIDRGVIRDSGDFLEMEDVYLRFFEDVLQVNEQRKYEYLKQVRKILRNIALTTLRNVIDLKRNIDNTYKNEPNYLIKKAKLEKLDEQRHSIAELIHQTEDFLDNRQQGFFAVAMDVGLRATVQDVRLQLKDAYHNILELDRQIIEYLNLIEYQNRLLKKLRKIKYLKDQMVLESQTNVLPMLHGINPLWMENRPKYTLKLSLDMLRDSDEGLSAIKALALKMKTGTMACSRKADPLALDYLAQDREILDVVSTLELKNAFAASGEDLYAFVQHYKCHKPLEREDRLVLFCQVASQFLPEMKITDRTAIDSDIEYPLIYPA